VKVRDIRDPDRLADLVDEVPTRQRRLVELREQLRGPFDDIAALGGPGVLKVCDLDVGPAGADPLDALQSRREDGRLDPVETARDRERPVRLTGFRRDLDLDAAEFARLLEVADVEFLAEQPFGLAEDRADDVTPLDHPVGLDIRVYQVLR